MKKILGIDEAGRGPVLGPMVLAGIIIPRDKEDLIREWGISDSKNFGSSKKGKERRKFLSEQLKKEFEYKIIVLNTDVIDQYVENKSLNILEQETAKIIIEQLEADMVVLDGLNLFKPLTSENIIAENKADANYLSVAAASILAKTERDELFDQTCLKYKKDFGTVTGGGYANRATLKFVEWYLNINKKLPGFYRKSYKWKLLEESINIESINIK